MDILKNQLKTPRPKEEAPYTKTFPDSRVERTQQPCQAEQGNKAESITTLTGSTYDPRDLIIANLSVENEILKKRLKEFVQASADIRNALDNARDKFAQFRDCNFY